MVNSKSKTISYLERKVKGQKNQLEILKLACGYFLSENEIEWAITQKNKNNAPKGKRKPNKAISRENKNDI